jgi:hypothetical protein
MKCFASLGMCCPVPVIARMEDVVSPEMITSGEPVRVVDALVVVDMLFEALRDAAR